MTGNSFKGIPALGLRKPTYPHIAFRLEGVFPTDSISTYSVWGDGGKADCPGSDLPVGSRNTPLSPQRSLGPLPDGNVLPPAHPEAGSGAWPEQWRKEAAEGGRLTPPVLSVELTSLKEEREELLSNRKKKKAMF